MKGPKKKKRIYKEAAKDRHTTHWDMDYLPRQAVDDLYTNAAAARNAAQKRRRGIAIAAMVAALLLGAAVLFLVMR